MRPPVSVPPYKALHAALPFLRLPYKALHAAPFLGLPHKALYAATRFRWYLIEPYDTQNTIYVSAGRKITENFLTNLLMYYINPHP